LAWESGRKVERVNFGSCLPSVTPNLKEIEIQILYFVKRTRGKKKMVRRDIKYGTLIFTAASNFSFCNVYSTVSFTIMDLCLQ
jgi:hypothetical protein